MSLTSLVRCLEIFQWQKQKVECLINQRSDFGTPLARVPVQMLVLSQPEQLYVQCILCKLCTKQWAMSQSWKMSNLLHGPISTNQILPREKRVNRDIFGTSNLQNRTYGVSCDELMWIDYQFMAVCPLILFFCTYLPKNGLFLLIILAFQTFYPNWPIFLHGYIRHIRDIFQLCQSN